MEKMREALWLRDERENECAVLMFARYSITTSNSTRATACTPLVSPSSSPASPQMV